MQYFWNVNVDYTIHHRLDSLCKCSVHAVHHDNLSVCQYFNFNKVSLKSYCTEKHISNFLICLIYFSFYAFRGLTYGMSGPMGNDPNTTQAAYKWLESWEI